MATTAILRPNRFPTTEALASPPLRPCRDPNPNSCRPRRRKRSPAGFPDQTRCGDGTVVVKFPAKDLVMGQVKILKRGEELKPAVTARRLGEEELVLCSTDRLGPEPETVRKQIRVPNLKVADGLYAGSAVFLASPPPSSLPLPAFFSKEKRNDAATSDLRRLLRLDLL